MKRFFTMMTLSAFLLLSFAACSKEKEKENNPTVSPAITQPDTSSENSNLSAEESGYIALGGYFTKDNTNLVIYISDSGWYVNGVVYTTDTSPLILSGPLTYREPLDLVYSADNQELVFTFAENSVSVVADKGTAYQAFAGTYQRQTSTVADSESVIPAAGSVLETLGRIAATYYITITDGALDHTSDTASITFDTASAAFDNAFMTGFILNYTDLFLSSSVDAYPEIATEYLFSTFEADALDALLQNASAGSFTIQDLDLSESGIVLKDGVYYVPCRGLYAGGISSSYTDSNPGDIPETLILEGTIADRNGRHSVFEMTLKTSANTAAGATGIQLDSVTYVLK